MIYYIRAIRVMVSEHPVRGGVRTPAPHIYITYQMDGSYTKVRLGPLLLLCLRDSAVAFGFCAMHYSLRKWKLTTYNEKGFCYLMFTPHMFSEAPPPTPEKALYRYILD